MIPFAQAFASVLSDPTFLNPNSIPTHVASAACAVVAANSRRRTDHTKPMSTLLGKTYLAMTPSTPNSEEAVLADMMERCSPFVAVCEHEMIHINARAMRPQHLYA